MHTNRVFTAEHLALCIKILYVCIIFRNDNKLLIFEMPPQPESSPVSRQATIQVSSNDGTDIDIIKEMTYTYLPNPKITAISRQGSIAR